MSRDVGKGVLSRGTVPGLVLCVSELVLLNASRPWVMTMRGRPPSDWYGHRKGKGFLVKLALSFFFYLNFFNRWGRRGGRDVGKVGLAEYLTGAAGAFPLFIYGCNRACGQGMPALWLLAYHICSKGWASKSWLSASNYIEIIINPNFNVI